ncbi:copper chaperone PCu(A)C [Novosphingobium aquiterrae]|uniref:Copper chaperone PCu(A)C n=1 Tax=Novosphingobium aquiterrae TaxID=624388 RepID=A0ABV6PJA3_9SPHN
MIPLRTLAASLALGLALAATAGCKQNGAANGSGSDTAASEAATPSPLSEARLILPAVRGNPAAAYFTLTNDTTGTRAISGIQIDGIGKTEVHQTIGTEMTPVERIDVAPGTNIVFEPGKLHIMAFDVASTLKPGDTTKITVQFATGDNISGPMKVEAAGAAAMGGMDHGDSH